jgi:hypothetical protein
MMTESTEDLALDPTKLWRRHHLTGVASDGPDLSGREAQAIAPVPRLQPQPDDDPVDPCHRNAQIPSHRAAGLGVHIDMIATPYRTGKPNMAALTAPAELTFDHIRGAAQRRPYPVHIDMTCIQDRQDQPNHRHAHTG